MITVPGYQVTENIYESARSLVYRARRAADNLPVILKVLKQAYPPPEKIAWFKREYEITHNLDLRGVVRAYSLETIQQRWVMVLEDFGGASLARLIAAGDRQSLLNPLSNFLDMAMQIAAALSQIHQQNIIHKDINPANIIYNPATGEVKLTDFGIASILSQENPTVENLKVLEGTLAYISPEQTGRVHRALDYRTDFYSLGATLYELLTGQPPFLSDDAVELVHCHIAKQPAPPHSLQPDIPLPLSELVLKLLAKSAEDRYQSAYGINADLRECLAQWTEKRAIATFPLGRRDVSDRFQISQKLYGREHEMAELRAAYDRVSRGGSEIVLISGHAGIGKTALARATYEAVVPQGGYFSFGKFDQLQQNTPYAALLQAFQSLIRETLAASAAHIADWRAELLAALGANGQVLAEVLPEIELLIGAQPEAPPLPPTEAQNRFNLVFQDFMRIFTRPEHPLVIFLDGLQAVDAASLNLLKLVMTAPDTQYLLLIGAYRDNEVDETHPLTQTVAEIEREGAAVQHLPLAPLALAAVAQLIADTLNCELAKAESLARVVRAKTRGNPFFMTEFLKSLYAEGLLKFNHARGAWEWDLARVRARSMTANVVELLVDKVQQLEARAQEALKLAACIGNEFDLQTLAAIYEHTPQETAAALWHAVSSGLILPLSDAYKVIELDVPDLPDAMTVEYRFAHNRIRQAVYSLVSPAQRQMIHQQLGRRLLQQTPPEERAERIFDIVNHLNLARELLDPDMTNQRAELAELNLIAGQRAKDAVAYETALDYLRQGIQLLGADAWQRNYDLTLALHVEATETAYLHTDFAEMARLAEIVLHHARTLLDKVRVYETQIQAHIARNEPLEALRTALMVLKLLGVPLPEKPRQAHILLALARLNLAMMGKNVERLAALPRMTDAQKLAAVRIISSTGAAAYLSAPDLAPLLVFKQISLSLKYGNAPQSAFAYASYGFILCGVLGHIDAGYRFGQLALKLVEQLNTPEIKAKIHVVTGSLVRHWKEHPREILDALVEGYQSGLATGDLEFAATAAHNYCSISYLSGVALPRLAPEMAEYSAIMRKLEQRMPLQLNELYRQVVLNLQGEDETPWTLRGESYDEEEMLPIHRAAHDRNAIYNLHFNKVILCYLFHEYPTALANLAAAAQYADGAIATLTVPVLNLYESLTNLAVCAAAPPQEQRKILRKVGANQRKLKKWARYAPQNHQHKFYLVEAERARVQGKDKDAREYYDKAINAAQENDYINEAALANELAARFYLARAQASLAQHYLREAHYAYQQWGAQAKVRDLETRYAQFFTETEAGELRAALLSTTASTTATATSTRTASVLDLISVVKASQTLSGEIVLDKLLAGLMKIVIENAGAQVGYLLLEKQGKWVIEARGAVAQDEIMVTQAIPLTEQPLPLSIINYVSHTTESVVLHNAAREGHFTRDRYIAARQPKSVLCMPLLNRGKLIGLLYLENNLTTGAFTADRLEVLNILSAQAAISIENANLYANMETLVERRTTELSRTNMQLTQEVAERKRAEKVLERRVALETLITIISTDFINLAVDEIDRGITSALQAVGEFIGADRCYVFQFSPGGDKMSNTHEWCALGIEPHLDQLQRIAVDRWPWWIERLRRLEDISAPRVADLPPEAFDAAAWPREVKSTIVVPLAYMGALDGFLGFDAIQEEQEWTEDIALLHIVGEMVTNALERQRTAGELRESQRQLEASYQREYERRKLSDTLREVAKIVSSTLERQQVLDSILAQLDQVMIYHRATVMLLVDDKLVVVAGRDRMGGEIKHTTMPADKYPINAATLQEKYPILLPDVSRDDRWRATDTMEKIRSFISAPLLVQNNPIGLLSIGRGDAAPYTVEDTQTAFAFASQVALAMHNAQLYAEAQERARRLALLHEISSAINSTPHLRTLLTATCQKLVENFHVDHSGVMLFDENHTYGEIAADYPAQAGTQPRIPLAGYTAVEQIIATGQPLAVYDAQHDPLMETAWGLMRDLGICSILIVPLIVKGEVIGTFGLDVTTAPRQFEADEIGLCQTIATQLAVAIDNARWLERERERLEQEVQTARQIQISLLPSAAPDIPGLDIAGLSQPARQVGGDFYSYFAFSTEHLSIAVGDVSGKGMQAALMMSLSVGLLSTAARRESNPAALLNALNAELRPHTRRNQMNTALIYLTLECVDAGWRLRGANAGLIEPLVRRRAGTVEWLEIGGLPLGMISRFRYDELDQMLYPGDELIVGSDGLFEAMNEAGEIYGFNRVAASVANAPRGDARQLQEAILQDVRRFVGGAEPHDDLTLVVVRVG